MLVYSKGYWYRDRWCGEWGRSRYLIGIRGKANEAQARAIYWRKIANDPSTADRMERREFRNRCLERGGKLAYLLWRAQSESGSAKGRWASNSGRHYQRKSRYLALAVDLLRKQPSFVWGWGKDEKSWLTTVLYVDLPTGQVSFHCERGRGRKRYPGEWDRSLDSKQRIVAYILSFVAG